jgi:hypothetical protein
MDRHQAIVNVVDQFRSEWEHRLDEIAQILDEREIPPSPEWTAKKQTRKARTWSRAVEYHPERVIKAIGRSIKAVSGQNSGNPGKLRDILSHALNPIYFLLVF